MLCEGGSFRTGWPQFLDRNIGLDTRKPRQGQERGPPTMRVYVEDYKVTVVPIHLHSLANVEIAHIFPRSQPVLLRQSCRVHTDLFRYRFGCDRVAPSLCAD